MRLVIRQQDPSADNTLELWLERNGNNVLLRSDIPNKEGTRATEARIKDTGEICLVEYGNLRHGKVEGLGEWVTLSSI